MNADVPLIIENIWTLIAAVVVLVVIASVAAMIVMLIMRRLGVKRVGKDGIELDEEAKRDADALYLQNRLLKEIIEEIDAIEYRHILAGQMDVVDREVDRAIGKMREVHLDLLIKHLGDEEARRHEAVERYENITEIVRSRMTDRLRVAMRDNGFEKMTEIEFQHYIHNKLAGLYAYIEHIIDNGYKHDVIGIVELREEQRRYTHEYGQMLTTVFVEAREIKRCYMTKVKCLTGRYSAIQRHFAKTGEVLDEEAVGCTFEEKL